MTEVVPILVLLAFVLVFGLMIVIVASLLGPKLKPSAAKSSSYECGLDVEGAETTRVPINFYLTAILFILFDIEIIFMYPWALAYTDFIDNNHGIYIFSAMFLFITVFVFGLFWEIRSRALEWN